MNFLIVINFREEKKLLCVQFYTLSAREPTAIPSEAVNSQICFFHQYVSLVVMFSLSLTRNIPCFEWTGSNNRSPLELDKFHCSILHQIIEHCLVYTLSQINIVLVHEYETRYVSQILNIEFSVLYVSVYTKLVGTSVSGTQSYSGERKSFYPCE